MTRSDVLRLPAFLVAVLVTACEPSTTSSGVPVPGECGEEFAVPALDSGESWRVAGSAAVLLCLDAVPEDPAEFLLVLHGLGQAPRDSLTVRVRGGGGILTPTPATTLALAPTPGGPQPDEAHHLRLRTLEHEALSSRLGAGAELPGSARSPAALPEMGSLLTFNSQSESACEDPRPATGEVVTVSERAIVVADTGNPSGGFSSDDYARFAADFDTLIAPLTEHAFGTGVDVGGHGRTILFFTREVNRLTGSSPGTVILGFFFARDLFPRETGGGFQGCAHSNETEILYLLVPDPQGSIGGVARSRQFVENRTLSTLAHEYQHLLNSARRLHDPGGRPFEETWLNEALSHTAEELLFFRVSGTTPRSHLGFEEISAESRIWNAFIRHQATNSQRLRLYLEEPMLNSPYDSVAGLATRGAGWSFLRYALDRRAGDDVATLRALVDGPDTGLDNVAGALGGRANLEAWMADWAVSLFADGRTAEPPPRFRNPSWNHTSLFANGIGQVGGSPNHPDPLRTVALAPGVLRHQVIHAGGNAFLRFGTEGRDGAELELTVADRRPPDHLHATLVRLR